MTSLLRYAADKTDTLRRQGRARAPRVLAREGPRPAVAAPAGGRPLLSLSCNDVLGLSHHPLVVGAAIAATRQFGAGAGGSPLVTGHSPPVAALAARLARLKGTEAALVFPSGTAASLGVIPALVSAGDLVLADALSHSCLLSGARLSGARVERFPHNDVAALSALLTAARAAHRHCLVVTETVFSMEGDRAPLAAIARLARAHDAWLLTDDAHGLGVLGDGRGGVAEAGLGPDDVPLQLGTLSKAAGSAGGYVCAAAAVVSLLHARARTFVYATALSPAHAAAADAALAVIETDATLRARPLALARRFAASAGLAPPASPIVPVVLGTEQAALAAQRALETEGFLAVAIRPPTVPAGTARLRLAFPATLPDREADRLGGLVASWGLPARPPAAAA